MSEELATEESKTPSDKAFDAINTVHLVALTANLTTEEREILQAAIDELHQYLEEISTDD